MQILHSNDENFKEKLDQLINRSNVDMAGVMPVVNEIIKSIRARGDAALKEQIAQFDGWEVNDNLAISQDEMKTAYENINNELKDALNLAYTRIKNYHEKQDFKNVLTSLKFW